MAWSTVVCAVHRGLLQCRLLYRLADWVGALLCAHLPSVGYPVNTCPVLCAHLPSVGYPVHTCQCWVHTFAQCWVHTFAQCCAMEREAPGSLGRVDWRGQSLKSSKEQLGIVKEKIVSRRGPCRHHTHDHVLEERDSLRDCEKVTPIIHFM